MTIPATTISGNFSDYVRNLIAGSEGFSNVIYLDPINLPTIGYGFALFLPESSTLRSDLDVALTAAGLNWTTAQKDFIEDVQADVLAGNITQAESDLIAAYQSGGIFYQDEISTTEGQNLFGFGLNSVLEVVRNNDDPAGSSNIGQIFQTFETSHAGTKQLAALYSMAYNTPELIGSGLSTALNNDNFAHAWVEIAYNHGATAGKAGESKGLMNRRLEEAELFANADEGTYAIAPDIATTPEILEILNALFNGQGTDGGGAYNLYDRIQANDGSIGGKDFSFETILGTELSALETEYTNGNSFDFLQYADETVVSGGTINAKAASGKTDSDTKNLIIGSDQADTISGKGGDDYLYGGAGTDTLTLGAGIDTVAGTISELNGDTVTDFELGDKILITSSSLNFTQSNITVSANAISIDTNNNGSVDIALNATLGNNLTVSLDNIGSSSASLTIVESDILAYGFTSGNNPDLVAMSNTGEVSVIGSTGLPFGLTLDNIDVSASGNIYSVQIISGAHASYIQNNLGITIGGIGYEPYNGNTYILEFDPSTGDLIGADNWAGFMAFGDTISAMTTDGNAFSNIYRFGGSGDAFNHYVPGASDKNSYGITNGKWTSMDTAPDGTMYLLHSTQGLYTIEPTDSQAYASGLTPVLEMGTFSGDSIFFDETGKLLLLKGTTSNKDLYEVDIQNQQINLVLDVSTSIVNWDGIGGYVPPANQSPEAQDDAFLGTEDQPAQGNVLVDNGSGVDSDPDSDPISVLAETDKATAQGGLVTILSNGDFTYTPSASFIGQDTFTYTLEDGLGGTDTATVTINVQMASDLPSIDPESITLSDTLFSEYPQGTDPSQTQTVLNNGNVVNFEGEAVRKMAYNYILAENTILEFDVRIDTLGDQHGIGVDKDIYWGSSTGEATYLLSGSGGTPWETQYNGQYSTVGEWQHYVIPIGQDYEGDIGYLTFFNKDSNAPIDAQTAYANIKLYEQEVSDLVVMDAVNFSEHGYNQGSYGTQTVSPDGLEVSFDGDTWRKYDFEKTITPDTVLEFDFKSTEISVSQGIGLDNSGFWEGGDTYFQVYGTANPGRGGVNNYNNYDGSGDWKTYSIRVGDFATGDFDYLVFLNDNNTGGAEGASSYRNIRFYEDPAEGTVLFKDNLFSEYGYNEDTVKDQTISNFERTMELNGDTWRKMAHFYTVTEDTVLEFDFKSDTIGDFQGIGFDTDATFNYNSSDAFWQVYGTNTGGLWNHYEQQYSEIGEWQHYQIRVGDYFTGGINYLTFVNEHDTGAMDADSAFANVRLYELSNNETVVLKEELFSSYGYNENGAGISQVLSEDRTQIDLSGDAWRMMEKDYTVTTNTVLEFDFKATVQAEYHGIGLDNSSTFNYNSSELFFQLYGTNTGGQWNKDFTDYDGSGDWQHFTINLGDYHTGEFDYLAFVNEHDNAPQDGESAFKNIRIYEMANADEIYNGDDTADTITGGSGVDVITGAAGGDTLDGAVGDDILYGQDGLDTLIGGTGADTFVFEQASAFDDIDVIQDFSLTDNDSIDIAGLIEGYDPLQDVITDFVQITDNGTDSYLAVDADGGANSFTQIATIQGVTGLTDEISLETNGNLITS